MKRKHIIIVMLLLLTSMITMQSCQKEDQPTPVIYKAAVPANPNPAVDAVVPLAGTSYVLTWEGNSSTWDVYVSESDPPALAQSGVSGNSYTFTTTSSGQFYWRVVTKDANGIVSTSPVWSFFINSSPDVPTLLSPENGAVDVPVADPLSWDCSDPQGDDLTFDVYLGTTNPPAIFATDVTDFEYVAGLESTTTYYWKIVAKDSHGSSSTSTIRSFTTGQEQIMTFTGDYTCDEPAEAYSYDVSFEKVSGSEIMTANYWNSGWEGNFTLDLVNLTYSMPLTEWTAGYSGIESGIIDPATGTITGTYTIFKNGSAIEQGVHTYTKK
jgi:hypothetical protein